MDQGIVLTSIGGCPMLRLSLDSTCECPMCIIGRFGLTRSNLKEQRHFIVLSSEFPER